MINYYKILGVSRDDGAERIRSRFRELSKSMHPDVGGDNDKYVLVLEAYHTLIDEESRKAYDKQFSVLSASISARPISTNRLDTDIYISVEESLLGCSREIEYGRSIIRISVPKRIADNSVVEIKDYKGLGIDIFATVHIVVPPSCELRKYRNRYELIYNLYMTRSMLGRQIRISPLGEDIFVTIPNGTNSGKMFKLKNKGCFISETARADLYVRTFLMD